jgi:CubicO group peptidase (beta-lactamase class C family)
VPGASVAVYHQGEVVAASGGVTNITTGIPLTPDTVMHIGSITKVFNATLVMQLVDEGCVDLEQPVLRYLPDLRLKDAEARERISVKMLLNHTSGIDGLAMPDRGHDEETIEKGVQRFADLGQLFSPGTEFSYCNAATVIAGYLAQRLTGTSWYELVRRKIFAPLQMHDAVTLPEDALLHRASVGHYLDAEGGKVIRTSRAFNPLSRAPAGTTLMMSATDLVRFAAAHMHLGEGPDGTRILSAQSAEAMQQVTVNNQGKAYTYLDVGIGWMVSPDGLLHHSGGAPGVVSVLYVCPKQEWAAAILTNAQHGLGFINLFMEPWLRELGMTTRPLGLVDLQSEKETTSVDAARYVGVYEDVAFRYQVSGSDGGIALSAQPKFAYYDNTPTQASPPVALTPCGAERFVLEKAGAQPHVPASARIFTFRNPDSSGRMQYLGNVQCLYRRVA